MISADIKTDVKQEIKELIAPSYNFSQKYLLKTVSTLKNRLGWYSIQLDTVY